MQQVLYRWSNILRIRLSLLCSSSFQERPQICSSTTTLPPHASDFTWDLQNQEMLTTSLPLFHCHKFQRIEIAISTIILPILNYEFLTSHLHLPAVRSAKHKPKLSTRVAEGRVLRWRAAPAALRGPRLHCSASPLPSRTAGHRGPVAAQRSTSRAASRSAPRSLLLAHTAVRACA